MEGVSDLLTVEVLWNVEQILLSRCSSDNVLSRLLIAPLLEPQRASRLARMSLSNGFATTARLLDTLVDLQPLLCRFVDHWLDLPPNDFSELDLSREPLVLALRDVCSASTS